MESSCGICLSGWRFPIKLLDCGHSFCEWCLIRYVRSYWPRWHMPCPKCRKNVRARKADELATNWDLQQVVENNTGEESMTASVTVQRSVIGNRPAPYNDLQQNGMPETDDSTTTLSSLNTFAGVAPISEGTARSLDSSSQLESDSYWRASQHSTTSTDDEISILGLTSEDGDGGTNSSRTTLDSSTAASYFSVSSSVEDGILSNDDGSARE